MTTDMKTEKFLLLGSSGEIRIEKNNIRLCDTLEYAKNGTMKAKMKQLFNL